MEPHDTRKPEPVASAPALTISGVEVGLSRKWVKTAFVRSESYVEWEKIATPEQLVAGLREAKCADIFTFAQRVPDIVPHSSYKMAWDNVAALPILGYSEWWEKRLNQDTRRCVRIAAKRGLEVRSVPFDSALCEGIKEIYNEIPVRRGRRFWHYGKDLETVTRENATFVDRSEFLGAYCGPELVGFLKMVYVGKSASIMQILSKMAHFDKKPMNALMAKAVEICNAKGLSYLFYRQYTYHKSLPDSLTEFKRRNGFEQINTPRYFVPLTSKGRIAISLGLQSGLIELVPTRLLLAAKKGRAWLAGRGTPVAT